MIILMIFILGLTLGSFVNALVWRLHEQAKKTKTSNRFSIVKGRSMCTNCRHKLSAKDLLPVLSWLALRGKCRYCQRPIHWQYPAVEISMALLLVYSYLLWPYPWDAEGIFRFVIWVPMLTVLLSLFIYDLRWMLLPDKLNALFFGLSAVQVLAVAFIFQGGASSLISSLVATIPLGIFFYVLFQLSDGKWIGGGDVKLGFGLGLLAGNITLSLLILLLASVIGSLVSIILIAGKGAMGKTKVPFGPFLITAAVIVQLYGWEIINWYLDKAII